MPDGRRTPDPYEGARWQDIRLRECVKHPRRRRWLRYLRWRAQMSLLLPGDRVESPTHDLAGEVLHVGEYHLIVRDDRTGTRYSLPTSDWQPERRHRTPP